MIAGIRTPCACVLSADGKFDKLSGKTMFSPDGKRRDEDGICHIVVYGSDARHGKTGGGVDVGSIEFHKQIAAPDLGRHVRQNAADDQSGVRRIGDLTCQFRRDDGQGRPEFLFCIFQCILTGKFARSDPEFITGSRADCDRRIGFQEGRNQA